MATVLGMGAIVGSPMRMPQTLLSLSSSPRAPFPGQMCLGSFGSTSWLQQLQSSRQRRPVLVAQNSVQSEARQAAEDETEEEGSTSESDNDVANKEESVTQLCLQGFREALAANDRAAIYDLEA